MPAATAGLATGLSVIVAVGAQNAHVLRQGLLRHHVGAVVLFCAASDVILISAGVAGVGVLVDRAAWVLELVRWLGVAFLLGYAAYCFRRAIRTTESLTTEAAGGVSSRRNVLARTAALTWLNPHLYLDIAVYGVLANSQGPQVRWWFAAGLIAASVLWFVALGYGARALAPLLARPAAWRVLDAGIGVVMVVIAAKLILGW